MVDTIAMTSTLVNIDTCRYDCDVWHTGSVTRTTVPPTATVCCAPGVEPLDDVEAGQLVAVLKALADPVRLRLVNLISQAGEACACDLPELLDRSQPTISHHLKVLVEAGILDREQRGKWAWFSVRTDQLSAVSEAFAVPARTV